MLDPQECFRNALPRARPCVPQGTPPDPLERPVKTVLFLEFWRLRGQKPAQNQRAGCTPRFPKEALFLRRCRRFLSPPLFYDVFHVFSLQKARILRCFGGGNVPKNAFWCPKGTCLMWFSKLPLAAGTHCQKHCFLEGKYGFCGAKRIVFRSFRPPKLANVSAKSAPFVGSRHFAASGAPFVSV